jgi:hypothetical protein
MLRLLCTQEKTSTAPHAGTGCTRPMRGARPSPLPPSTRGHTHGAHTRRTHTADLPSPPHTAFLNTSALSGEPTRRGSVEARPHTQYIYGWYIYALNSQVSELSPRVPSTTLRFIGLVNLSSSASKADLPPALGLLARTPSRSRSCLIL